MIDEESAEAELKNYISCLTWVRRGVAAAVPDKIELTAQELQNIIKDTHSKLQHIKDEDQSEEDDDDTGDVKNRTKMDIDKIKKENADEEMEGDTVNAEDEFNFEKYDEESENVYANLEDIAVISDTKDPLITVDDGDDEDSETEDDVIKPADNLVLVGHIIDEASILEVYVYNEAEGSFYCHHHDYLPYIPLCFEWLSYDPSDEKPGNLCAIGNDTPIIEVWDLDIVGGVGPVFKLGKKPNKKKHIKRIGHKDAVLDIAWNTTYSHVLASGSADKTVLLWDMETSVPSTQLSSFEGIVQSIKWHHNDAHLLLTGSMDKTVRLFDCKTEQPKLWKVSGEVEKVLWDNFNPNICYISTNNGYIESIDIRQNKVLWKKNVQQEEIAGLSMSKSCPGLLVSSNKDGTINVWDVANQIEPKLVYEKQTNLGQIICLEASCESPFTFAVGGDNKAHNLNVYDLSDVTEEAFKNHELKNVNLLQAQGTTKKEPKHSMIEVTDDLKSIVLDPHKTDKVKKKKPRHRDLKKRQNF